MRFSILSSPFRQGLAAVCLSLLLMPIARAQIFEANFNTDTDDIEAYNFDGTPRTVSSILGLDQPFGVAISDSNLFVVNGGSIGQYTTSGGVVNPSLVTGLSDAENIAVSGDNLFVTMFGNGTVAEYSTSGDMLNPALIENFGSVQGIAAAGNELFVVNAGNANVGRSGYVSEYTLGATPGTIASSIPFLITGLASPDGIAISGSSIFVAEHDSGTIAEYSLSGAAINSSLVTGLNAPDALAASGDSLFVANTGAHTIGEYTTSGDTVNAALVSDLTHGMRGLAVAPLEDPPSLLNGDPPLEAPEPQTYLLLASGLLLLAIHRFRRAKPIKQDRRQANPG